MNLALPLGIVIVALCAHASFIATRAALSSPGTHGRGEGTESGDRGVPANPWAENPHRLLALTLVATSITTVIAGTAALQFTEQLNLHPIYALVALTSVAVLAAEALPRSYGNTHGLNLSTSATLPSRTVDIVLAPLVAPISAFTTTLYQTLSGSADKVSREEIVRLLDEGESVSLDPEDRQMIQRILEMPETEICDCMTPLVEVVAISESAAITEVVAFMLSEGHSRIPVYKDRIDNIVGLVTHRDVLFQVDTDKFASAVMRPVLFVPESKRVDEMLHEMRADKVHFAIVVDEYGGTVGVITLEDLIEEIVGEIRDERDTEEPGIRMLSNREWRIPARTEIEEVADVIGVELPEGNYETVAGYILSLIGRIPEAGEIVRAEALIFRIEQTTDRAIHMVHLTLPRDFTPKG
jgi:CBS domain containing-hemolysin-like protein